LRVGAIALLFALPYFSAQARPHRSSDWADSRFDIAERMREALNGRPAKERARTEYQRVVNAYRRVYYGSPTASKASLAVVAEAEVMVEMGRQFDDPKILRLAIRKYEFLRSDYPGSSQRVDALFTIGEIYREDLNDADQARETFTEFLRRYPKSRQADDARRALSGIEEAALKSKESPATRIAFLTWFFAASRTKSTASFESTRFWRGRLSPQFGQLLISSFPSRTSNRGRERRRVKNRSLFAYRVRSSPVGGLLW